MLGKAMKPCQEGKIEEAREASDDIQDKFVGDAWRRHQALFGN